MALQNTPWIYLPRKVPHVGDDPQFNNSIVDSPGEKYSWILTIPETGSIQGIGFRTGPVTAGGDITLTLETVDSNGNPSGTLIDASATVDTTIDSADDNTWITSSNFPSNISVSQGDIVAIVLTIPVGSSFDGQISNAADIEEDTQRLPRYQSFNGTIWLKSLTNSPVMALRYSDGTYKNIAGFVNASSFDNTGFSASDSPDEKGLKFTLPFGARLIGFWHWSDPFQSNHQWHIYDSADTELANIPVDVDYRSSLGADGKNEILFPNSIELVADEIYRVTVTPNGPADYSLYTYVSPSEAVFAASDHGNNFFLTSRTNGGAWTDSTTQRPYMGIILDQLDLGEVTETTSASTTASSSASSSLSTTASTSASSSRSSSLTSTASTSASTTASTTASTSASTTASTSATSSLSTSLTSTHTSSASTSVSTSGSSSVSSSISTTTASTGTTTTQSISTFTQTAPPEPTPEDERSNIPMLRLNNAGDSPRNPIIKGIRFTYRYHRHGPNEVFKSLLVRDTAANLIFDLSANVVEASDYLLTVAVNSATNLLSGFPNPVLNIFHMTTEINGVFHFAKHGLWVVDVIDNMVLLDGYNANVEERPTIFRPTS